MSLFHRARGPDCQGCSNLPTIEGFTKHGRAAQRVPQVQPVWNLFRSVRSASCCSHQPE